MNSRSAPMEDNLVECPYQSHMVAQRRFLQHLAKCEKHPNSRKLDKCPFNAQHRIAPQLMAAHLSECPSSRVYLREIASAPEAEPTPWVSTDASGGAEEDEDNPWNSSGDRKPFIAPGLGGSKKNARRPDGSINPLIYQSLSPAEKRAVNMQRPPLTSSTCKDSPTSKPSYQGMGRGKKF